MKTISKLLVEAQAILTKMERDGDQHDLAVQLEWTAAEGTRSGVASRAADRGRTGAEARRLNHGRRIKTSEEGGAGM